MSTHLLDIAAIRSQFPALERMVNGYPLVYLDNAATTLKPLSVAESVGRHYSHEASNVHRGVHELSEQATARYEETRRKVRAFINARHVEEIIFTSGATAAINLVAQSWGRQHLKPGDEIVVTYLEHHANIVPWQMIAQATGAVLKPVAMKDEGVVSLEEFTAALTPRTKLAAFTAISNAIGTIVPYREMITRAKEAGATVLIDGAQLVAHLPVDVQALGCDFLAFSGHKLYGPTGTGVLYGRKEILETMPPVIGGGAMIREVTFERTTYAGLPERFEAGTPHVAGVIGLGTALDWMTNIGWEQLKAHEEKLVAYGVERLTGIKGLRLIGPREQRAAIFSFTLAGIHPHDVGSLLNDRGVAIRSGHHCCQPLMKRLGVPATSRASLGCFNTTSDIDALADAIHYAQEVFAV